MERAWLRLDRQVTGDGAARPVITQRGTRPVLLSAPHAIAVPRADGSLVADRRTGGLALLLARMTGAYALVTTEPAPCLLWRCRDDPFASAVRAHARAGHLVLDLHGMRDIHGPDVCLGTRGLRDPGTVAVRDLLRAELADRFLVTVDQPFAARAPHTVTTLLHTEGGTGVQVELAARLRDPAGHPLPARSLVLRLARAIDRIAAYAATLADHVVDDDVPRPAQ